MEFILSISLILMAWIYSMLVNRAFANPVVIFLIIWGAIFALYGIKDILFEGNDLLTINIDLGLYYIFFCGAFLIGGCASLFFNLLIKTKKEKKINDNVLSLNAGHAYAPQIAIYLSYISIIAALISIYQLKYSFTELLSIGESIRRSITLNYEPTQNIASLLSSYAAYIALPISICALITNRRRRIWAYMPIIAITITSLITLSKYGILFVCVVTFSVLIIHRGVNITNFRPFIKAMLSFIIVIVFTFGIIGAIRGVIAKKDDSVSVSGIIVSAMYMYGVGHINTFANYYYDYNKKTNTSSTTNAGFSNISVNKNRKIGERTFSGFYRILYWMGVVDTISYTRYEGLRDFNTSSILRSFIDDFGLFGAILASSIAGFICQFIFILCKKKTLYNTAFLSYVLTFVIFTPIHSLFNFIFFYIVLIFVPIAARFKVRL